MLRASSIALQTSFVSQDRVGTFMGISSSLTVRLKYDLSCYCGILTL